jgi:hypothetical protein
MKSYVDILMEAVSPLCEAKMLAAEVRNKTVRVWRNPSHTEFTTLARRFESEMLRGLTDSGGNLFVWNSYDAIHYDIGTALDIDVVHQIMMREGEIQAQYATSVDELMAIPGIARAFGPTGFDLYDENYWHEASKEDMEVD